MATDEWTASSSGNWGIPGDWSGGEPTSTSDVVIASDNDITVTSLIGSVTVNTVDVFGTDELLIQNGDTVTATNGAIEPIFGTVVVDTADFIVGSNGANNTFYSNAGILLVEGNPSGLFVDGSVSFISGGTIELSAGAIISGDLGSPTGTLTDVNNVVVSDSGVIGAVNFINETSVEAATGGSLTIEGSAVGGSFDNQNLLMANTGGTLFLGVDQDNATITNTGTIELENNESGFTTKIEISGGVTISGNGQILFSGANSDSSSIVSDGSPATLTLVAGTLSAAGGSIGDTKLTLNLQRFAIEINENNTFLVLAAASMTMDIASIIEAVNGGEVFLEGQLSNGGLINVGGGGEIFVTSTITNQGAGVIDISQQGTLSVLSNGKINGTVQFEGGDAILKVTGNAQISTLAGMAASDAIDVASVAFVAGAHAVWEQTSTSGGTLLLENGGIDLASFNLLGQYNSLDFAVSSDGHGGALITAQNTPSYAENPGNNDEWILSDGNWVESAGPGPSPTDLSGNPYQFAGIGDWTGNGTDGILWYDPSTGDTNEWQLSNTQWASSVDLGSHPGNFQISGTGAFFGNGIDDVLWTNTSGGGVQTDIWELNSSGQWVASVSPGSHPAGYTVVGTGDWTGNGTDGILWYNASNGDTDEWQLANGQWSASVDLGSHPGSGWTIAGVGDFFDNGHDDVLWTNSSGGSVQTDIWELGANGQWVASVSPGTHPAGYQVAGVGDFTGLGTSDILWYNASTGDTDEWLINNGQWSASIDLDSHPGGFQIAGVGDFNGDGVKGILWHASS